jgi:hypothetical protein
MAFWGEKLLRSDWFKNKRGSACAFSEGPPSGLSFLSVLPHKRTPFPF